MDLSLFTHELDFDNKEECDVKIEMVATKYYQTEEKDEDGKPTVEPNKAHVLYIRVLCLKLKIQTHNCTQRYIFRGMIFFFFFLIALCLLHREWEFAFTG